MKASSLARWPPRPVDKCQTKGCPAHWAHEGVLAADEIQVAGPQQLVVAALRDEGSTWRVSAPRCNPRPRPYQPPPECSGDAGEHPPSGNQAGHPDDLPGSRYRGGHPAPHFRRRTADAQLIAPARVRGPSGPSTEKAAGARRNRPRAASPPVRQSKPGEEKYRAAASDGARAGRAARHPLFGTEVSEIYPQRPRITARHGLGEGFPGNRHAKGPSTTCPVRRAPEASPQLWDLDPIDDLGRPCRRPARVANAPR